MTRHELEALPTKIVYFIIFISNKKLQDYIFILQCLISFFAFGVTVT